MRREGTATIGDNRVRKIQPAFPLSLSLSLSPKSKELRSDELCIEGRRHPMKYGGGGEGFERNFSHVGMEHLQRCFRTSK